MTRKCHICQKEELNELLDLGPQPISNRYPESASEEEYVYPMVINQCQACGLVQINNPPPATELVPRYDWITYNEPEDHLDQLVDIIGNLPGLTQNSKIGGVSFKDDTILTRLNNKGFKNTWRIAPKEELGIDFEGAGAETIQQQLTPEAADKIVALQCPSDVIIVRHIFEHVHNIASFVTALKRLISPNGYIIFEVPDCSRALGRSDCTTLWEEHTLYFTPEIFKNCFLHFGLSLTQYASYPYPFENSLVGIVQLQAQEAAPQVFSEAILNKELSRAQTFARNLMEYSQKLQTYFLEYRREHGPIALFGAGHLAGTFVNIFGLKKYIDFVVDDNPHKKGLLMPGSKLPIYGSAALREQNIQLCLLSLNPLSEEKVVAKNQDFVAQGGVFASIFPGSSYALEIIRMENVYAV